VYKVASKTKYRDEAIQGFSLCKTHRQYITWTFLEVYFSMMKEKIKRADHLQFHRTLKCSCQKIRNEQITGVILTRTKQTGHFLGDLSHAWVAWKGYNKQ
jgi:hypothetical protein